MMCKQSYPTSNKPMTLSEKYWLTIFFTFLRYFSILMMGSGIAFILLGYYLNPWYYAGLAAWPLFIMWGIVNFRYIAALTRFHRLEFSRVEEGIV